MSRPLGALRRLFTGHAAYTDLIITWDQVRERDLVILDDHLVRVTKVSVCQKPWGEGATFTAVDVSHQLANGQLVTSERHGDRFTAVRRYATGGAL